MEKILLIDNDCANLIRLSKQLEKKKYQVYIAQDGMKGLDLAMLIAPSLIICEINISYLNGLDILEKLSQFPQTSAIPVILITSKFSYTEMTRAMELCADSYLVKPIETKILLHIIEKKLSRIKGLTGAENVILNSNNNNQKLNNNSSLLIEIGNSTKLIKTGDIEYVIVEGDYTNVYIAGNNRVLVRRPLKIWEEILPDDFIRIHRSVVINMNLIESIEKWYKRAYRIHMYHSKEVFISSQRFTTKLRSKLKI